MVVVVNHQGRMWLARVFHEPYATSVEPLSIPSLTSVYRDLQSTEGG